MPYRQAAEITGEEILEASEFDAFLALAEEWGLTTEQQITLLGNPGRSTFFKWKKDGGQMSRDTEERVSNLLGIYKALQILFPDPERANQWIRRDNSFFGGRSALDVMLDGHLSDIISVRAYLDAQRGG
jgi:uncharacterized protein (DUF2384 family)